jgi:nitrogen regulatory protein P-II 1
MPKKPSPEPLLMICIVCGREFLDNLLEAYLEIGISGATVIQSQGMGSVLVKDVPLFAGLRELLESGGPFNYTVLSAIEDPALVDEVLQLMPSLRQGELSKGILLTVPISRFVNFENLQSHPPSR